jgi:biopolymer transport protein ExbD
MKSSLMNVTGRKSPLSDTQKLNKGRKKKKGGVRELGLALPLTSLIDAFSIIVIYLLIGTQGGNGIEAKIASNMTLPAASQGVAPDKEMPILRIQKGRYFLNDKPVAAKSLTEQLSALKKDSKDKVELMIQADQEMQYADLDPLLKAGSLAGIEKLKFAVMPEQ